MAKNEKKKTDPDFLWAVVDAIKFFGGNLDFPKLKKLNKICSYVWTCTFLSKTMLKNC